MPTRRSSLSLMVTATCLMLAACEAAAPSRPGQTGPAQNPGAAAAAPVYGALGPAAAPDVTVAALRLTTKAAAGTPTMADLDTDTDPNDTYTPKVPVTFTAADYSADPAKTNGTIAVRGQSTRLAKQKSYKINLDKTAPKWRNTDEIQLNKHPFDRTRLRNKLAFDLFQSLPDLAAPRTWFASLNVDSTDYGLFTQIERIDKSFLKRLGLDADGYLYKAESFEFQRYADALKRPTDPGYDVKAFEKVLEINGNKDHERLIPMLDAVNDEKQPINAVIAQHFDRANFLTWLAVNVLTENLDTNSRNYFLYAPRSGGPWRFIPWDYDASLGYYEQGTGRERTLQLARWQEGPANWWNSVLVRRFCKDPENVRQLVARIDQLAEQLFTPARMASYIDAYRPVVKTFVTRLPDAQHMETTGPDGEAIWKADVDKVAGSVQAARSRFMAAMKRPMPVYLDDQAEGGQIRFTWDASYDLQGDALRYDLKVARDPGLTDVVAEHKDLTGTEKTLSLPAGTYYWTVTVRDATGEWQAAYTDWTDPATSKTYWGIKRTGPAQ